MTTPPDIARDAIEEIKKYNKMIRKRNASIESYRNRKSNLDYSYYIQDLRIKMQKAKKRYYLNIMDFIYELDKQQISYKGEIENIQTTDLIPFFLSVLNR